MAELNFCWRLCDFLSVKNNFSKAYFQFICTLLVITKKQGVGQFHKLTLIAVEDVSTRTNLRTYIYLIKE